MATSEAAHNAALAQRDQQIAKLQSDLQKLQIAQQAFSQQDAQIAQINAQMKELHTTVEALRPGLPQPR
jgi:chromosome segregation ATPase